MNKTNNGLSLISSTYSQYRIMNDMIYMLVEGYNGLFRASVADGKVELIKKFEQRNNYESYPFYLVKKGDKLFFLPGKADEVAIYDQKDNKLSEIPFGWGSSGKWHMREYTFFNEHLWLFPLQDSRILEVDYEGKKIVSTIELREIYRREIGKDYVFFSAYGCYCCDEQVFLACYGTPHLVVFDLRTKKITFLQIPEAQKGFTAMMGKGKKLYVLNADGRLMIWDINKRQADTFVDIGKMVPEFDARYYLYMNIVGQNLFICNDVDIRKIIIISLSKSYSVSMGMEELIEELESKSFNENLQFRYFEENLLYGCNDADQYYCFDLSKKKLREIKQIIYNPVELKKAIKDESKLVNKMQTVISENEVVFEDFIHGNIRSVELDNKDSQVGRCIYQSLIDDF